MADVLLARLERFEQTFIHDIDDFKTTFQDQLKSLEREYEYKSKMRSASQNGHNNTPFVKVKALWEFEAEEEDELPFEKDEVLIVKAVENDQWWWGEKLETSQIGLFPKEYVVVLEGSIKDLISHQESDDESSERGVESTSSSASPNILNVFDTTTISNNPSFDDSPRVSSIGSPTLHSARSFNPNLSPKIDNHAIHSPSQFEIKLEFTTPSSPPSSPQVNCVVTHDVDLNDLTTSPRSDTYSEATIYGEAEVIDTPRGSNNTNTNTNSNTNNTNLINKGQISGVPIKPLPQVPPRSTPPHTVPRPSPQRTNLPTRPPAHNQQHNNHNHNNHNSSHTSNNINPHNPNNYQQHSNPLSAAAGRGISPQRKGNGVNSPTVGNGRGAGQASVGANNAGSSPGVRPQTVPSGVKESPGIPPNVPAKELKPSYLRGEEWRAKRQSVIVLQQQAKVSTYRELIEKNAMMKTPQNRPS